MPGAIARRGFLSRNPLRGFGAGTSRGCQVAEDARGKQQGLLKQSVAATAAGQHGQAAAFAKQATRFWPEGVKAAGSMRFPGALYAAATGRFQTLTVGVVNPAGSSSGCPFPNPVRSSTPRIADAVALSRSTVSKKIPYYRTDYFEQYEPTDPGRQVEFTLRPRPASWQAGPGLTSDPIVSMLSARIDPKDPGTMNGWRCLSMDSRSAPPGNLSSASREFRSVPRPC
ncbi:MAG: hypothetical protein Ct9H300mP1_14190 [Planctomycetaceae bacterium]|nr:MAG: hypothetical protein Ct9H300mP1_14190 [Planctomycetaceae bacterium]